MTLVIFLVLTVCGGSTTTPTGMYTIFKSYTSTLETACEEAIVTTHSTALAMHSPARRELATHLIVELRANASADQLSVLLGGLHLDDLIWVCRDVKQRMTTDFMKTLLDRLGAIQPIGDVLLARYAHEGKEAQAIFEREKETLESMHLFHEGELLWLLGLADKLSSTNGSAGGTRRVPQGVELADAIDIATNPDRDAIRVARTFIASIQSFADQGANPMALAGAVREAHQILVSRNRERFDHLLQGAEMKLKIAQEARNLYAPEFEAIEREVEEIKHITNQISPRLAVA
jgi:hypothetical protein